MKKITFLLLATIAVTCLCSFIFSAKEYTPIESIKYFKGNFAEAMLESKNQNKPIFLDAYTDWCYWCKRLDKTTFNNSKVVSILNDNFIVLKMNMEKGEGPAISLKYNVTGYPTMLFFNSNGEVINGIVGYTESAEFINEANKAMKLYANK